MKLKEIQSKTRIRTYGGKKTGVISLILIGLFIGTGTLLAKIIFQWLGWI